MFRYLFLVCLILVSCSTKKLTKNNPSLLNHSPFLTGDTLKKYMYPLKPATKENYPEDEAVILYEEKQSEIARYNRSIPRIINSTHILKKLLKNINNSSETTIYLEPNEDLIEINARVILPNDSILVLGQKDFITADIQFGIKDENNSISGKTIKVIYPKIVEDAIIEYNWKSVSNFEVFGRTWVIEDTIASKIYAKYTCYAATLSDLILISMIDNFKKNNNTIDSKKLVPGYNYQLYFDTLNNKVEFNKNRGSSIKYQWIFRDISSIKREPKMPPDLYFLNRLSFNYYDKPNWENFAYFYYKNINEDPIDDKKYIRTIYDSLVSEINTNYERMERLTNYVRQIRYQTIPLGTRGIIPQSPFQVIKNSYGDCKDKANLLIYFFNIMGIQAYPAIILTADKGIVDKSFPTWNFNHMIVYVKDSIQGEFWIDPTVPKAKLKQLPWTDQGVNALILGSINNVGFVSTPINSEDENRVHSFTKIYNLDSVFASIDIRMKFYGEDDLGIRNSFFEMPKKFISDNIKLFLSDNLASSIIDSIYYSDFNDFSKPFEIFLKLKSDRIMNHQGNSILMDYNVFGKSDDENWSQNSERKYPVFIPFKSNTERETEIHYPNNLFKVNFLPDDFSQNIEFCQYEKTFLDDNNGIIYCKSQYIERALSIPADKFKIAKQFNLDINKYNRKQIIFNKVK